MLAIKKQMKAKTSNFNSIEYFGKKNLSGSKGKGRVIKVNAFGMLFEADHQIDTAIIFLEIAELKCNPSKIKGELIFCYEIHGGMYHIGIKFIGSEKKTANLTLKLLELLHRKGELMLQIFYPG